MLEGKRAILILLVVSLLVQGGLLVVSYVRDGGVDGNAFNSLDCGEFFRIGVNVARNGVFSDLANPPLEPDTWRTPGYPLFLAAIVLLAGESPAAMIVAQQVVGVISVLLLFGIARRHMSERRAVLCSFLFLVEPYRLWYSLWLMSTTLFVLTLLLTWATWQRWVESRQWNWAALMGVIAGYAVLVRPVALLVPLVLLAGLAWRCLGTRSTRDASTRASWAALVSLVVFAVACSGVVGAWMLRNQRVAGHAALSDQGGVVLAYFKATEVALWREGRTQDRYLETSLDPSRTDDPHRVWDRIDGQLRKSFPTASVEQRRSLSWRNLAQGANTTLDSFEVSAALGRIGRSILLESPWSTGVCWVIRAGSLLTFPLNLAVKPPNGVMVNQSVAAAKSLIYVLLCAGVVVRLVRRRCTGNAVFFPLACTAALLVATSPQLDPRFRVPMIPFLIFVATLPVGGGDMHRESEESGESAASSET